MGAGFDFVRNAALQAAKAKLAQLLSNNNIVNTNAYQPAQLNDDRTQATYADGTTGIVSPAGNVQDYGLVINNKVFTQDKPQTTLGGGSHGIVAGFGGQTGVSPQDNSYAPPNSPNNLPNWYYIRNAADLSTKLQIPTAGLNVDGGDGTGLDDRIQADQTQVLISPDGKAVLIGGSYEDFPPYDLWSNQPSQGLGGCQGNCYSVPGYTYHTFANWLLFTGVSLVPQTSAGGSTSLSPNASGFMTYNQVFYGSQDITNDCNNKIPAPVSEGIGSAAIYKLMPSQFDLYGCEMNGIDQSCHTASARFFPMTVYSYTQTGYPFEAIDYNDYGAPCGITNVGSYGGYGYQNTTWVSDPAGTNAMFKYESNTGIQITRANIIYVLTVTQTGNSLGVPKASYIVDIVSDLSYSIIYSIASDYAYWYSSLDSWFNPDCGPFCGDLAQGGASCQGDNQYTDITQPNNYLYTWDSNYPYLAPFYNSFNGDVLLASGTQYNVYVQSIPWISYTAGGNWTETNNYGPGTECYCCGITPQCQPCNCCYNGGANSHTNSGSGTTNFYQQTVLTGPLTGNTICGNWTVTISEQDSDTCVSGGQAIGLYYLELADNWDSVSYITDWDGTSFTLLEYGNPYYLFWSDFQVDPVNFPGNEYCPPSYNPFVDLVGFNFGMFEPTGPFFQAYRFGRGIAAFEQLMTVSPEDSTGQIYQDQGTYVGPAITLFRLASPLNQNHAYGGFRSFAGGTAVVYQDADPYVLPNFTGQSFPPPLTVDELLNNPQVFDGTYVPSIFGALPQPGPSGTPANSGGFSMYFWGVPYITDTTYLPVDHYNTGSQTNQNAVRPDVFTDMVLSASGAFPYPNTYLKGVDSLVIEGLAQYYNSPTDTTTISPTGGVYSMYRVQGPDDPDPGLTTIGAELVGPFDPSENILDFILTINPL